MAVGSIVSAVIGNSGAKKAAKAEVQAAQMGIDAQKEIYGKNEGYLSPFVQAGMPATQRVNALLGLAGDTAQDEAFGGFQRFLDKGDYAFNLDRGLNQINAGYAGAGTLKSGAAMKGIEDYRQGLNQQYLGQYMGALGNQQGLGLSAGSALAGVGQGYADSVGQLFAKQGDARANSALTRSQNTANAVSSGLNALFSLVGGGGR